MFKDSLTSSDVAIQSGDSGTDEADLDLGKLEAEAKEVAAMGGASRDGPTVNNGIKKTRPFARFAAAATDNMEGVPSGGGLTG